MEHKHEHKTVSEEAVAEMERLLFQQAELLQEAWRIGLNGRARILMPLALSIHSNCKAVSMLTQARLLNDTVIIARALVERVITFCYLMVADEDEFQRYKKYTMQKFYRRIDRKTILDQLAQARGEPEFTHDVDLANLPQLQDALNTYTGTKGREITRWSRTSLEDRIQTISERTNAQAMLFSLATSLIYEDASEALHATLYGSMFHLHLGVAFGLDTLSFAELEDHKLSQFQMLLVACISILNQMIFILSTQNDIPTIVQNSNEGAKAASELLLKTL